MGERTRTIPLSRGLVALVDESDYKAVVSVGKWHAVPYGSDKFYAMRAFPNGNGRKWKKRGLHAHLTGWALTDHVNGDGLDNRRSNLRPATQSQNMANVGLISTNTSGYRGVSWAKESGKWYACIKFQQKKINLGYHATPEEAAAAWDEAAAALFGDFARLNFAHSTNLEKDA